MYTGCCEVKDVGNIGNGQRQNNVSWARIFEIQRRLKLGKLELVDGWSRIMPGSYHINGSCDQIRGVSRRNTKFGRCLGVK